jgi:hypothetical protein
MTGRWARVVVLIMAGAMMWANAGEAKPGGDRKYETDWRTGVTVAPGAYTWTSQNHDDKKKIIGDTAAAQSRTCSHYAFLQWPPDAGTVDALRAETRRRYETQGYAIDEKPGGNPGETLWLAAHPERQTVVLWGTTAGGTTVYLSCITAGGPAANPDKPLVMSVMFALGLGALGLGGWLFVRTRAQGRASAGWPTAAGTIKSSVVQSFRTKGSHQYQAAVTYKYAVNGRAYTGDRIRFGAYAGSRAAADAEAAKYSPETAVQVRYDPRNPGVSTLEPGTAGLHVWGLVLGIVGAMLVGLATVMLFIE